ncbi:MAG: hypothetical protein AABZ53_01900 [Planctomycetota bacterium]
MPLSLTRTQTRIAASAVVLTLAVGIAWAVVPAGARHTGARSPLTPAQLVAREQAAAQLAYPTPRPSLPASIVVVYDDAKDRTRMTLTLRDVRASASGHPSLSAVELTVLSEYQGHVREPGHGELSVRGTLSLISKAPGVLAPSSPPGIFTADAKSLKAKPVAPGKSGYQSKSKPDGSHESLAFHLSTKDLLTIAASRDVTAQLGAARVTLTPAHLELLREFAARMNPNR